MPTKTKKTTEQAALPGDAFKPGAAELPTDPDPNRKLPDASDLSRMGKKFATHAEHLRELLEDVQALASLGWPITDPDCDGNRVETINALLEMIEYPTGGRETLLCDGTLATTIGEITEIADDLSFGPNQASWAKMILMPDVPAEHPKPAGTPRKSK
jgi:hypothetical protein